MTDRSNGSVGVQFAALLAVAVTALAGAFWWTNRHPPQPAMTQTAAAMPEPRVMPPSRRRRNHC